MMRIKREKKDGLTYQHIKIKGQVHWDSQITSGRKQKEEKLFGQDKQSNA